MAVPVLPGILEIWKHCQKLRLTIPVATLLRVNGIGTSKGFWWPILVGSWRRKTPQLPDTNRILLLNGRARPAPSKDSGSCSTLLARLRQMQWGTRIQLIHQHSPDGFRRSAAQWLSWPVETRLHKDNSNQDSLFRNFRGARQGPGREITVAQLAVGYLCLWQPEKQKDSPGWGCSRFYTTCMWCLRWHSTIYTIYQKFGMTCMMPRPE